MSELVTVCKISELGDGEIVKIEVSGEEIAVGRINDVYYAIQGKCTHKGAPLHQGAIKNGCLVCPWHKAEFDPLSGKVKNIPFPPEYGTATDLKTYKVRVENGDVLIET